MQITEIRLGGGGMLRAVETNKFKRSSLFLTRVIDVSPETTPLDLLLMRVLGRCTEDHPSHAALTRHCEQLYGASTACFCSFTDDRLLMTLCGDLVSDAVLGTGDAIARGVVQLMASIWQRPLLDDMGLFPADEVEHAKVALCNSIRAADNDPASYAARRCRELTGAGSMHGYSVGIEEVEAITPERLTARYRELRQGGFGAFYVGDAPQSIAELLEEYFEPGSLSGQARLEPHAVPRPTEARRVDEQRAVEQGKLCMSLYSGVTVSDAEEYYATLVAAEVLGGSPVAKLFMNVRERLGLCYYCNASYDTLGGVIYIASGVAEADRVQAEREIMHQLDELRQGHITEDELEAARLSLINSALMVEDRPDSIWHFTENRARRGLSWSIEEYIDKIRAVTADRIAAAASGWRLGVVFFVRPERETDEEDEQYDS